MKKISETLTPRYFLSSISTVLGIVLIWRGMWYMLDRVDIWLFGGNHLFSATLGIVLGLLILYLPDHDLEELKKL